MSFRALKTLALVLAMTFPAAAAVADSGGDFDTVLLGTTNGLYSSAFAQGFGADGSRGGLNNNVGYGATGDFGGVNYLSFATVPTYNTLQYGANSLSLISYANFTGTPSFNVLLYTGSIQALANQSTIYQAIVSNSVLVGTVSNNLGYQSQVAQTPSQLQAFLQGVGFAQGHGGVVGLAITSGTIGLGGGSGGGSGAGAPGPVAGAGLPFLVVAGIALLARRRRQARLAV